MQIICTSLQTDNHASTSSLNFYRPDALPDAQSTEGNAYECPVILNQLVIRVAEFFRCHKKHFLSSPSVVFDLWFISFGYQHTVTASGLCKIRYCTEIEFLTPWNVQP